MSVSNGQPANAATFNDAFVSKQADSSVEGVITLSSDTSGAEVANLQETVNTLLAAADQINTVALDLDTLDDQVQVIQGDVNELVGGSRGIKYAFNYTDLQNPSYSSGMTFGVTGLLLPDKVCVDKVVVAPTIQLAGSGFTGAKVNIGAYLGDNYTYMPTADIGGAPGVTNWKSNLCCDVDQYGEVGGNGFDVYVTITGCNMSALTAGQFYVYFYYSEIDTKDVICVSLSASSSDAET